MIASAPLHHSPFLSNYFPLSSNEAIKGPSQLHQNQFTCTNTIIKHFDSISVNQTGKFCDASPNKKLCRSLEPHGCQILIHT